MKVPPRRRNAEGDEEFIDPALATGLGSISELVTYPRKKRGVKKRPIGFCRDIDKLEDAE